MVPYAYLGCYSGRFKEDVLVRPAEVGKSDFTLETCADYCQGKSAGSAAVYKYMSLRSKRHCECSNEIDGTEAPNQQTCLKECGNDSDEGYCHHSKPLVFPYSSISVQPLTCGKEPSSGLWHVKCLSEDESPHLIQSSLTVSVWHKVNHVSARSNIRKCC